jgi:hypothetical protein
MRVFGTIANLSRSLPPSQRWILVPVLGEGDPGETVELRRQSMVA